MREAEILSNVVVDRYVGIEASKFFVKSGVMCDIWIEEVTSITHILFSYLHPPRKLSSYLSQSFVIYMHKIRLVQQTPSARGLECLKSSDRHLPNNFY